MEKHPQLFDVCIVCALPEEARAFLEVVHQQSEDEIEERSSPRYKDSYRFVTLKNNKGELLNLHISWLPRYGPQEMTLHLSHILEECQPRIVIMTGICAGDAQRVQLGDLVVAERTFTYDNGKFTYNDGRMVHWHDTLTYQLDSKILQFLTLFDNWKSLVAGLQRPLLTSEHSKIQEPQEEREIVCYLKPMASGSAVRADNPFEDVQAPVRGTVAIDMEGAAFGLVMSHHPLIRWLVVKGVCDYADRTKNDAYHDYAARASALYALSFIRAYVTNERLPRLNEPLSIKPAGASEDQNISHTHKSYYSKRSLSFVIVGFLTLFFVILLGRGISFQSHNTTNSPVFTFSHPQQVLNQFCTDLEKGQYRDINDLIAPMALKNNGGPDKVPKGWANLKIKTCHSGTVQREVNTNVFTGIITFVATDTPPSSLRQFKVWIDDTQGSWKISTWGSV